MTPARTLVLLPVTLLVCAGFLFPAAPRAQAQLTPHGMAVAVGDGNGADSNPSDLENVSLPYSFHDDQGNEWHVRANGTMGRSELFPDDGYGWLFTTVGVFPDSNQARWSRGHNQLIIGPSPVHGVRITRFLDFDKKKAYCRCVDLYENNSSKEVRFDSTELYFKVAGGWHARKNVGENAESGQVTSLMLGSAPIFTGLIFAGHGSSHLPKAEEWDQLGISVKFSMVVPAHGVSALMHVQVRRNSADEVVAFLQQASDADFLKNLPAKAVGHVYNFDAAASVVAGGLVTHIGKYELARGDLVDTIELRNGDHCKGTITDKSYRMQTSYGAFEFPAADVAGIISLSPSGTRQLLVTTDRQALAGRLDNLDKASLHVELPGQSGNAASQTKAVPLADIAQAGYRPRPHEGEVAANRPQVLLRGGDVLAIDVPPGQATMVTRYGVVRIPFDSISAIGFDNDALGLHDVRLTDGSHFGALLESNQIPLHLHLSPALSAGAAQPSDVRFPPGSISHLVLAGGVDKLDNSSVLKLANEDLLVGTFQGRVALDTALETMDLDPDKILHIARIGEGNETSLRVTFTDDAVFTGPLHDAVIPFVLSCGAVLQIPVDQLREFTRPRPVAAPATAPATAPTAPAAIPPH